MDPDAPADAGPDDADRIDPEKAPAGENPPPPPQPGGGTTGVGENAALLMNGASVTADLATGAVQVVAEAAGNAGEVFAGAVDAVSGAAEALGGVVESAGSVPEGASGCLDGCSGCSLALLFTLFAAGGTAWAIFQ
jgi:hypothetical protein